MKAQNFLPECPKLYFRGFEDLNFPGGVCPRIPLVCNEWNVIISRPLDKVHSQQQTAPCLLKGKDSLPVHM